jgi:hypothetical protein
MTRRIDARRGLLLRRVEAIREREAAGECPTAWFLLDALQEELELLAHLQRAVYLCLVRDGLERSRS